jgi:hypothetical protein
VSGRTDQSKARNEGEESEFCLDQWVQEICLISALERKTVIRASGEDSQVKKKCVPWPQRDLSFIASGCEGIHD